MVDQGISGLGIHSRKDEANEIRMRNSFSSISTIPMDSNAKTLFQTSLKKNSSQRAIGLMEMNFGGFSKSPT